MQLLAQETVVEVRFSSFLLSSPLLACQPATEVITVINYRPDTADRGTDLVLHFHVRNLKLDTEQLRVEQNGHA